MPKVKPRFKNNEPRHKIRQWRKHRGLTLEQLAERIGVTHGALSQLERGEVNYTQPMLEALADELRCTPGDLVTVDPTQDDAIWSLWDQASVGERNQIVAVATAVVKAKKAN